MKVDEFAEKTEEESKKEPEDYMRFVFIDIFIYTYINKNTTSTEPNKVIELHEVQTKS